jgi:hypothetical protein
VGFIHTKPENSPENDFFSEVPNYYKSTCVEEIKNVVFSKQQVSTQQLSPEIKTVSLLSSSLVFPLVSEFLGDEEEEYSFISQLKNTSIKKVDANASPVEMSASDVPHVSLNDDSNILLMRLKFKKFPPLYLSPFDEYSDDSDFCDDTDIDAPAVVNANTPKKIVQIENLPHTSEKNNKNNEIILNDLELDIENENDNYDHNSFEVSYVYDKQNNILHRKKYNVLSFTKYLIDNKSLLQSSSIRTHVQAMEAISSSLLMTLTNNNAVPSLFLGSDECESKRVRDHFKFSSLCIPFQIKSLDNGKGNYLQKVDLFNFSGNSTQQPFVFLPSSVPAFTPRFPSIASSFCLFLDVIRYNAFRSDFIHLFVVPFIRLVHMVLVHSDSCSVRELMVDGVMMLIVHIIIIIKENSITSSSVVSSFWHVLHFLIAFFHHIALLCPNEVVVLEVLNNCVTLLHVWGKYLDQKSILIIISMVNQLWKLMKDNDESYIFIVGGYKVVDEFGFFLKEIKEEIQDQLKEVFDLLNFIPEHLPIKPVSPQLKDSYYDDTFFNSNSNKDLSISSNIINISSHMPPSPPPPLLSYPTPLLSSINQTAGVAKGQDCSTNKNPILTKRVLRKTLDIFCLLLEESFEVVSLFLPCVFFILSSINDFVCAYPSFAPSDSNFMLVVVDMAGHFFIDNFDKFLEELIKKDKTIEKKHGYFECFLCCLKILSISAVCPHFEVRIASIHYFGIFGASKKPSLKQPGVTENIKVMSFLYFLILNQLLNVIYSLWIKSLPVIPESFFPIPTVTSSRSVKLWESCIVAGLKTFSDILYSKLPLLEQTYNVSSDIRTVENDILIRNKLVDFTFQTKEGEKQSSSLSCDCFEWLSTFSLPFAVGALLTGLLINSADEVFNATLLLAHVLLNRTHYIIRSHVSKIELRLSLLLWHTIWASLQIFAEESYHSCPHCYPDIDVGTLESLVTGHVSYFTVFDYSSLKKDAKFRYLSFFTPVSFASRAQCLCSGITSIGLPCFSELHSVLNSKKQLPIMYICPLCASFPSKCMFVGFLIAPFVPRAIPRPVMPDVTSESLPFTDNISLYINPPLSHGQIMYDHHLREYAISSALGFSLKEKNNNTNSFPGVELSLNDSFTGFGNNITYNIQNPKASSSLPNTISLVGNNSSSSCDPNFPLNTFSPFGPICSSLPSSLKELSSSLIHVLSHRSLHPTFPLISHSVISPMFLFASLSNQPTRIVKTASSVLQPFTRVC